MSAQPFFGVPDVYPSCARRHTEFREKLEGIPGCVTNPPCPFVPDRDLSVVLSGGRASMLPMSPLRKWRNIVEAITDLFLLHLAGSELRNQISDNGDIPALK